MTGRSAKVSSLSDKIQGLKFMQRAASTSNLTQKTEDKERGVSAAAEVTDSYPEDAKRKGEDPESEQWTMRVPKQSYAKRMESRIVAEPGWNHWLGHLLDERKDTSREAGDQNRMVFGAWAEEKRKKRKAHEEDKEREDGGDDGTTDGSDFSNDEPVKRSTSQKSFLKPGSISKKTDLRKAENGKTSPGKQQTGKNAKRRKS